MPKFNVNICFSKNNSNKLKSDDKSESYLVLIVKSFSRLFFFREQKIISLLLFFFFKQLLMSSKTHWVFWQQPGKNFKLTDCLPTDKCLINLNCNFISLSTRIKWHSTQSRQKSKHQRPLKVLNFSLENNRFACQIFHNWGLYSLIVIVFITLANWLVY